MEKLKRSLSFRKKKEHVPECSKPHQWQEDERKVREGTCSFQVRVRRPFLSHTFAFFTHLVCFIYLFKMLPLLRLRRLFVEIEENRL